MLPCVRLRVSICLMTPSPPLEKAHVDGADMFRAMVWARPWWIASVEEEEEEEELAVWRRSWVLAADGGGGPTREARVRSWSTTLPSAPQESASLSSGSRKEMTLKMLAWWPVSRTRARGRKLEADHTTTEQSSEPVSSRWPEEV